MSLAGERVPDFLARRRVPGVWSNDTLVAHGLTWRTFPYGLVNDRRYSPMILYIRIITPFFHSLEESSVCCPSSINLILSRFQQARAKFLGASPGSADSLT